VSDTSRAPIWEPLDLSEFERKPKTVIRDDEFVVAIPLTDRQRRDYAAIVGLIRVGGDLGPYYRRSTTADRLLTTQKVLHLHLGGAGSDAILYAVQYPEHVLLVRIDTHIHLDDLPPGKRLPVLGRGRFQASLKTAREDAARNMANAKARLVARIPKPKA
jgi:hypothetical protein